jgi:hypothetical protein
MSTDLNESKEAVELDPEALVQSLDARNGIPVEAIRKCQQHRELVIPHLIQAIEKINVCVRGGEDVKVDPAWISFYLLWEFQVKVALPVILAAVPGEAGYKIFSDGITEDLPRVLATLACDNLQAIDDYIGNRAHDPYSRSAAANSYQYLVRDGVLTRATAVEHLAGHLREERDSADEFASFLVCALIDLNPHEALAEIREAFSRGVIQNFIVRLENVETAIAGGDDEFARNQSNLPSTHLADTVELLQGWHCFQPKPKLQPAPQTPFEFAIPRETASALGGNEDEAYPQASATIRNESPRIGRNEPCPCGSGKKYKKCCLRESPL